MSGVDRPQDLFFAVLAPFQAAAVRTAQLLEDFRSVAGVQHDKPHAAQYTAIYALHDLVLHAVVRHVSPPDQHIGVFQHFFRQAVLGLLQGSCLYLHACFFQKLRNAAVDALRVDRGDLFKLNFMQIFVPNRYFNGHLLSPLSLL